MADLSLPSQELLLQLLRYDAEAGRLFWLERPLESFARVSRGKVWNTRFAGKEGGSTVGARGYAVITVNGRRSYSHRVMWMMMTGEIPEEIDHINGNRLDNRFINLRSSTRNTNGRNLAIKKNNTSGVTGVYWNDRDNRWQAYGRFARKMEYIGQFTIFEDAKEARRKWELAKGFHPNHGQR